MKTCHTRLLIALALTALLVRSDGDHTDVAFEGNSTNVVLTLGTFGSTNRTALLPIPPTLDALFRKTGLGTNAAVPHTRILRRTSTSPRITIYISATNGIGPLDNELMLQPGDIVFVPEWLCGVCCHEQYLTNRYVITREVPHPVEEGTGK